MAALGLDIDMSYTGFCTAGYSEDLLHINCYAWYCVSCRRISCSQDITSVEDVGDLSMLSCISSDPWNALFNLQAIAIELQRSDGETVTRKAWVTYPSINPPFRGKRTCELKFHEISRSLFGMERSLFHFGLV